MKLVPCIQKVVIQKLSNLNKISLNRGGSYIDSPKWLKNKNAAINPKSKDDKCFYAKQLH